MSGLRILSAGLRSTLQDLGRTGSQHLGLAPGGAADLHAFRWANKLLENDPNGACIETLMGQFQAEARSAMTLAVTGADTELTINGRRAGLWRTHNLKPGDRLALGATRSGLLNYVAVKGGWQGERFCNSRSMTPREQLPGFTQLESDQEIPCADGATAAAHQTPAGFIPDYAEPLTLRVIPGYQYARFSLSARHTLATRAYDITQQIDRMGYRLAGPALEVPDIKLLSEGISLGAIQVPADGQPIVLLNDRQTMGGYPKIGTVAALDCSRLCQRGPGAAVRFQFAELANVQCDRALFEAFFERTEWVGVDRLRWP
ncbi:5-oxoprolinase subunit C family protein [Marinobacter bohaiensis]|uniref:5-oxoprolinase subunit C family protein n=1 Tax=Marinobacter bohaiensis TaxID=2201898 RepID=UPI000DAD01FB|nr:biotin-dependent carboxyltransferase family protein [Marinobacter bohaiensis]